MPDARDVEEAQEKRQRYLLSFYDLVKDRPIRWATHQEIADGAGLDVGEGVSICQLLSDRRLVEFRTTAGAQGSVELTSAGVAEAERLIQQVRSVEPQAVSAPSSADDAREWVEANAIVVEEAFTRWRDSGEWPDVRTLQRALDQRGLSIEVQPVVDSKPRVTGEARLLHTERLTLRLRHLMWVRDAANLVEFSVAAVQKAFAAYMSDAEEPSITSAELTAPGSPMRLSGFSGLLYDILSHEHPSPFAGSTRREDTWTIQIDSRFTRTFRNVDSIEAFVARQDEIRARFAPEPTASSLSDLYKSEGFVVPYESVTQPTAPQTEHEPQLFLSWSRPLSKGVAAALLPVLRSRLPGVSVFFSPESIEPGDDPSRRMFDEGMLRSDALIVVLTAEGAGSAFVIWETATAWARDKLVIPVFVDIAPTAVPGPLHTKVQGVHLRERHDVDRALHRLATQFGINGAASLADSEYESLLCVAEGEAERS